VSEYEGSPLFVMRLLFHDTSSHWSGSVRAFFAAGRVLAARGHEVMFSCAPRSALEWRAREAQLPTVAATGRAVPAQALGLRRSLRDRVTDVIFVHDEAGDLAASAAVRMVRRGAVVRRLPAGESLVARWRTDVARRLAPVTYFLTASPVEIPPPPAGTIIRGELGVAIPLRSRERSLAIDGRATPRLACIATGGSQQRVYSVLRTVALLAERHPRIRLTVMGYGLAVDELRVHAASLNIARLVDFLPASSEDEGLANAELVWVVADGDDAAFGCLSAMARGLPVFSERTAVTEHFVTAGIHGELFRSLQPPLMAATVADYAAQPAQRARVGHNARLRVEREFSEREMANAFERASRNASDLAAQDADIPATDLAATDLAATDLAATDLAATDLAATDLAATDVAVNDLAAADIPGADIPAGAGEDPDEVRERPATDGDTRSEGDGEG
jgi:glycosyltransferase involved in cell wall biosynthesis